MFALPDMLNFFMYKLSGGCRWRLSLSKISFRPFRSGLVRHPVILLIFLHHEMWTDARRVFAGCRFAPGIERCLRIDFSQEAVSRFLNPWHRPDQAIRGLPLKWVKGQHRRAIHFDVVKAIEKVNAARTGRGDANAKTACEFGVSARHECSRFLMPHMNKADLLLVFAQRLESSVDAVAWQAENRVNALFNQAFNEHIGSIHDENLGLLSLAGQSLPAALEEQISGAFETQSPRSAKPSAGIGKIHAEYA
jgi:hypothetical protein